LTSDVPLSADAEAECGLVLVLFMVFNATFNNIPILLEETGENHQPGQINFIFCQY
jgi:hypothetical protein